MEIFNTHTHINAKEFENDYVQALERAAQMGVNQLLMVAYDDESLAQAFWLKDQMKPNQTGYVAFGCHPENCMNYAKFAPKFAQLSQKIVAIGEIGLDYHTPEDVATKEEQCQVFEAQLKVAEAMKLPVLIHNRDAFADTLAILDNAPLTYGAVMHSFNGDEKLAEKFLQAGCHLSYSGVVTYANATDVAKAMMATPLNRLLVETDDPYLAPQPYRSEKNEPGMCRYTLEFIANKRHLTASQLAQITKANAERILGL